MGEMHKPPLDIDLDSLPGPKRGVSPALYVRDEAVFSPKGNHFALAYSIAEASNGNEIGCLLWGTTNFFGTKTLGNPPGVHVTCWYSPWAIWLDDETFVFKAQQYDGSRLHLPLVVAHVLQGFAILPDTNNGNSRPSDVTNVPLKFTEMSAEALINAICRAT
jgi:hypothetical protein